ncbi:UNVERIFIED_CONTAM: hypothetical protein MKS84_25970 [Pseudomonas sp. JL1]
MAHLTDMEELVASIKSNDIRDYMSESLACYMAGAYRASVVLTFIALFDDIIGKLGELARVNKKARTIFETATQKRADQDVFETYLIDQLNAAQLFTTLDAEFLGILRKLRNKAAHPSGHHASAEEARFVFQQAVSRFLSRPVLSTTQLSDEILISLSNANMFPSVDIEIITKVVRKELEPIHFEAYPYLIGKILNKTQESDSETSKNARFFLTGMARTGDVNALEALKRYVIEQKLSDKKYVTIIHSLLCSNGALFSGLDEVAHHRLSVLIGEQISSIDLTVEHTKFSHPTSLFLSLFNSNDQTVILEKLGTQFNSFLDKFTYSAFFCANVHKFERVRSLLLEKYYERAGSTDFHTANGFARNVADIERSMGQYFTSGEAFKLIIKIIQAANCGAFSAIDIRNSYFGAIPNFKRLANSYLIESTNEATDMASSILGVSKGELGKYFEYFNQPEGTHG